jgi:hypothetical protein
MLSQSIFIFNDWVEHHLAFIGLSRHLNIKDEGNLGGWMTKKHGREVR